MRREMFTQELVATLHCTGVTCNYYIIPYLVHTRMYNYVYITYVRIIYSYVHIISIPLHLNLDMIQL